MRVDLAPAVGFGFAGIGLRGLLRSIVVPPCKVEIPDLIELQREYPDQLVILGIDVRDEFTRVKPFADRMKVNYPLLDANNRQDVEDAFAPMWGLPTTVIVGPDGKVAKRHSGIATKEQLKEYVESLL
jgi:thiol-disulfide isomerase/thioredoxin